MNKTKERMISFDIETLPTIHPAYIVRHYKERLERVARILEDNWLRSNDTTLPPYNMIVERKIISSFSPPIVEKPVVDEIEIIEDFR